jgi:hypothetical protein
MMAWLNTPVAWWWSPLAFVIGAGLALLVWRRIR